MSLSAYPDLLLAHLGVRLNGEKHELKIRAGFYFLSVCGEQ